MSGIVHLIFVFFIYIYNEQKIDIIYIEFHVITQVLTQFNTHNSQLLYYLHISRIFSLPRHLDML